LESFRFCTSTTRAIDAIFLHHEKNHLRFSRPAGRHGGHGGQRQLQFLSRNPRPGTRRVQPERRGTEAWRDSLLANGPKAKAPPYPGNTTARITHPRHPKRCCSGKESPRSTPSPCPLRSLRFSLIRGSRGRSPSRKTRPHGSRIFAPPKDVAGAWQERRQG